MPVYPCNICNFSSRLKSDYERHLKTKKHINNVQSYINPSASVPFESSHYYNNENSDRNVGNYSCQYCNKRYKYKQSLDRHTIACLKINDADLKDCIRLINDKKFTKVSIQDDAKFVVDMLQSEIEKRNKAIQLLMKKVEMNSLASNNESCETKHVTNIGEQTNNNNCNNTITNNTINNTQNIILNYKDTDMSHLTATDYRQIIGRKLNCIPELIRRIHCNHEQPQNMNVYITNIQSNFIMLYEDGSWILHDRDEVLETLIEDRTCRLEEWIDDNPEESSELKEKFDEYMDYRDKNYSEVQKSIKHEIQKDLYNIRHKINKAPIPII